MGRSVSLFRRRRWSIEEAKLAVAAVAESGLTESEFAARNGIELARLQRWRRRLDESSPQEPVFVEIVREADRASGVEIAIATGEVVRVARDFDEPTLRAVV